MARYTGPKNRISRREKINIYGKESASLERRLSIPPGVHGPKGGGRRLSDYGKQLREKQKAKRIYGLLEKQFARYFSLATKEKGATGAALLQILESRLDNVLYRLGLTKSRNQARQIVNHGHVLVDGKTVDIPSYNLKEGQIVTLNAKAQIMPDIKKLLEEKTPKLPSWLERKAVVGKVTKLPKRDEIDTEINEQLIVEFYSR